MLTLWLRIIGLGLLLIAWGAENFWKSNWENKLNSVDFITINSGIVSNTSELQFLKYITQNRKDPKLLTLSYRFLLQETIASFSILKNSGANPPNTVGTKAKQLLELVENAYQNGKSLEPKDINGRNIKYEIVLLQKELREYSKDWLIKSRANLQLASKIFIIMYILGSLCIIGSAFTQHYIK